MAKAARTLPALLRDTQATFRRHGVALLLCMFLFAGAAIAFRGLAAARLEQFRHGLMQEDSVAEDLELLDVLDDERRLGNEDVESEIREIRQRLSLQLTILAGRRSMWVLLQSPYFLFDVGPFLIASFIASFVSLIATVLFGVLCARQRDESLSALLRHSFSLLPSGILLACAGSLATCLFIPAFYIFVARTGMVVPAWLTGDVQIVGIFLGYFIAVLIGPRLALSPAILPDVRHTRAALWRSWDSSYGYWGKILWSLLVVSVGLFALGLLTMRAARFLSGGSSFAIVLTRTFLFHVCAALIGVFVGHLAHTIEQHPRPKPVYE